MTRLPAKTLSSLSSRLLAPALAVLLSACSVVDRAPAPKLEAGARWVVLPFANATETPFAGQRAEAISEGLLRTLGVADVQRYPAQLASDNLFENGAPKDADKALDWARGQNARYAVTGTVDEWRYKVGVDGEPAVGVAVVVANAVVMRLRQMATLKPLPRRLALKPSMMPCRLLPRLPLRLP